MSKGYTLVELLVVLAIMGLMSLGAFVNLKSFREEKEIITAASELQNFIRIAQSNATTGLKCDDKGGVPWLIIFDNETSVKLACWYQLNPTVQKTLNLVKNIKIGSIQGSDCADVTQQEVWVLFDPVTGKISFIEDDDIYNDPEGIECTFESSSLTITLDQDDTTRISTVEIDKGGVIR